MVKRVKREAGIREPEEAPGEGGPDAGGETRVEVVERRLLRSRYLAVKNLIVDEIEDISKADSEKFKSIITEVETLHRQVQKPREQVADAEALLDIANTLVTSVRSHGNDGRTPSDFVTAVLQNFCGQEGTSTQGAQTHVRWRDLGLAVSSLLRRVPGCCTMLGPMNSELKPRKPTVHRKRTRPTESTHPEELQNTEKENRTGTDKNMSTMFDILRKNRRVGLENLVLNRDSFAQTVENIFVLSFLVKDGRAEITIDDKGHHLVLPRNAPAASAVAAGEAPYHHFVFRFDFMDWKLMMKIVGAGEELMPNRSGPGACGSSQVKPPHEHSQSMPPTTPIRKLTKNRGLVTQEQPVMEESPENDASGGKVSPQKKGKRLLL